MYELLRTYGFLYVYIHICVAFMCISSFSKRKVLEEENFAYIYIYMNSFIYSTSMKKKLCDSIKHNMSKYITVFTLKCTMYPTSFGRYRQTE